MTLSKAYQTDAAVNQDLTGAEHCEKYVFEGQPATKGADALPQSTAIRLSRSATHTGREVRAPHTNDVPLTAATVDSRAALSQLQAGNPMKWEAEIDANNLRERDPGPRGKHQTA